MCSQTEFLKRTWAEINLDAIRDNFKAIVDSLSAGCQAMAIVKADAYGHGAAYISRVLKEAGVSWFGVSNLDEALQIRDAGIDDNILILGFTPPKEAARLAGYGITQTVLTLDYAKELSSEAVAAGVSVHIHVKLDTGMSRIGFLCQNDEDFDRTVDEVEEACRLPGLIPEGVFTHFASADEEQDDGYTCQQFTHFKEVISRLEACGIKFKLHHCCNSAATMRFPEMHWDMVRPGVILYGLSPSPWMKNMLPLKPAMELKTVISMTKTVPAGTKVSYGRTFTAERDTKLATVPIGYADGYPRSMSNRAKMLVGGQRAPVVGRVCMDQCMLDVTDIKDAREGMTVTVFGTDGGAGLPVEEFSELSGTINYETVCLIGKRVPRVFLRGGKVVGQLNYIVPGTDRKD